MRADEAVSAEDLLADAVERLLNLGVARAADLHDVVDGGLALGLAPALAQPHQQAVAHQLPATAGLGISLGLMAREPVAVLAGIAIMGGGESPLILHRPGQRQVGVLAHGLGLERQQVRGEDRRIIEGDAGDDAGLAPGSAGQSQGQGVLRRLP